MNADIKEKGESAGEVDSFHADDFKVSAWGYRHQQSLILFFTLTIAYSMRSCMGVALVAMTHDLKAPAIINVSDISDGIGNSSSIDVKVTLVNASYIEVDAEDYKVHGFFNALMLTPPYPTFKWSKKVQDTIISSFFWGYMLLQIPAGQLAHRFGAKSLLIGAMLINCFISAFLPLVAYYGGWISVVILRVIAGLSQACILPGFHTFFGKWAPLEERGRLTSLTYGGQAFGTVLGLPITGFIASTSLGWPGLFRIYAILSGTAAGVVWWFAADTPSKHSSISAAEKKYIEEGLGQKAGYDKRQLPVPWSKILRCIGVYAIIIAHIGNTWGQLVLYSEMPAFMDKVMGVNIKANGLLTALPFMVMWFTNFFFSWFTDMLIVKKVMSVTNVRKLANSMGCIPSAIGLVALAYVPKNIYVVETIFVIICAFKISSHLGFQVNHIDITPNFAGTLMSISNFVSNGVASLAPLVTAYILTDVKSEFLWRQVFFVAAGLYFFTNLFYCIFGNAEIADWNDPDYDLINTDEKINTYDKKIVKININLN